MLVRNDNHPERWHDIFSYLTHFTLRTLFSTPYPLSHFVGPRLLPLNNFSRTEVLSSVESSLFLVAVVSSRIPVPPLRVVDPFLPLNSPPLLWGVCDSSSPKSRERFWTGFSFPSLLGLWSYGKAPLVFSPFLWSLVPFPYRFLIVLSCFHARFLSFHVRSAVVVFEWGRFSFSSR